MATKKAAATIQETISIPPMNIGTTRITIEGDSILVLNRFSEKNKKQMEEKTQKKAVGPREARNPKDEFLAAMIYMPDKKTPGFPSHCIKKCIVGASRFTKALPATVLNGALYVIGESGGDMVQIRGSGPHMREDDVRVGSFGNKKAMIRYRPEFRNWSMTFTVRYNADMLSLEQLINLVEIAGFSNGLGEWRAQKGGNSWGAFHVKRDGPISKK